MDKKNGPKHTNQNDPHLEETSKSEDEGTSL